jgi:putative Holliday junction resolvase
LRLGVRLGIDWGKARIGVAACDREAILCFPVETVDARRRPFQRVVELVGEYQPIELIMGLPRTLGGANGLAADSIREVAEELAELLPDLPIRLVDERLSTAAATRLLRQAGKTARQGRSVIDQVAAVTILEMAVEYERSTGRPLGELLEGLD